MLRSAMLVVLFSLSSVVARATAPERLTLTSPLAFSATELQLVPTTILLAEADTTVESKNVNVTTAPNDHNYMLTIAANMGGGALVGFLLGGAIYLMQDSDNRRGVDLGWWTGGGAIVGLAAGVVQVAVIANRDTKAVSDRQDEPATGGRQVLAWGTTF